jgi:hypothetical protein
VTELDNLQSFIVPECHPNDYESFRQVLGLRCDSVNYVISDTGLTYYKDARFFPRLIYHSDQTIELPKPSVDCAESIGFLDDRCLFWKSETFTRLTRTHYYLTDIHTEPKEIKFLFSDTSNNKPNVNLLFW